jgi:hypothetical protein
LALMDERRACRGRLKHPKDGHPPPAAGMEMPTAVKVDSYFAQLRRL